MKIVFMGTPDFAVKSLEAIHKSRHEILAVVTLPDKKQGRGQKELPSAVKVAAESLDLKLIQPESLKSDTFKEELVDLEPECIVVVAFQILPESIFTIPVFGTINIHGSLLPKYRGAAPINHAILNGEKKTGVTSFYINEEVDAGTILCQSEIEIDDSDTFASLYDKLAHLGAELIVETLDKLDTDGIAFKVQDLSEISYAPKITKESCLINWKKNGNEIINQIRAFSPKPGAFTYYNGLILKILKSRFIKEETKHDIINGTIFHVDKNEFHIKVSDGFIIPTELQLQGKKLMLVKDFLNGNKIKINDILKNSDATI
jgi:methionyl-tRNA formyltransferase